MLKPDWRLEHRMSAAADRVTVIVVTFNSAHCISALAEGLRPVPHVLVVDNASQDNTAQEVSQRLPRALWVPLETNRGFGAANNAGVRLASTEFVLLLNPDCTIGIEAIEHLVQALDDCPQASAAGPQLIDRKGLPDISYRWRSDGWSSRGPGASGLACVGFFTGACMLIRREAMTRIGGFDEDFFLYYEDDDLCLRLQDACGPLLLQPLARVQHLSRGSVGGKARLKGEFLRGYHHIQSKFRFQAKHRGQPTSPFIRLRYGCVAAIEAALRLMAFDTARACRCAGRVAGCWGHSP